jgi:hypothetical protein
MYPEVKEAVASGKCLIEWDGDRGDGKWEEPPVPLLKDMFSSQVNVPCM